MAPRRSTRQSLSEATTPTTINSKPNSNGELDSSRSSPASSTNNQKLQSKTDYSDSEDELDLVDQSSGQASKPKLNRNPNGRTRIRNSTGSPLVPGTEGADSDGDSKSSKLTSNSGGRGGFTIDIPPPKTSKPQARKSKDRFDLSDAFGGGKNGKANGVKEEGISDEEEEKVDGNDSESSLSDLDFLSGKTNKVTQMIKKTSQTKVAPRKSNSIPTSRGSKKVKNEDEDEEVEGYNGTGFPTSSKAKVSKKAPVKALPKAKAKAKPKGRTSKNATVHSDGDDLTESEGDKSDSEEEGDSDEEDATLQQAIAASLGQKSKQKKVVTSSKPTKASTKPKAASKAPISKGTKRSRPQDSGEERLNNYDGESNWDDSSSEDEDFGFTSNDDESHFDDEIPDEGVSEDEIFFKESRASATKEKGKARGNSASTSPVKGKGKGKAAAVASGKGRPKIMEYDEEEEEGDEEIPQAEESGEEEEVAGDTTVVTGDLEEAEEEESVDDVPLPRPRKAGTRSASFKEDGESEAEEGEEEEEEEDSDDDMPQAKPRSKAPRAGGGFLLDDEDESEDDSLPTPAGAGPSNWQQKNAQAIADSARFPGSGRTMATTGDAGEEQMYETAKQREKRLRREARAAKGSRKKKPKISQYEKTRKALNTHHPELEHIWEDLKSMGPVVPEALPQPEGLNVKLLPFQREGLGWLVRQEKSDWAGGVLADEMGMGKTIQMISLFLSDRKKPCLVIAPTVAIMQWRNEIEKYTKGFKVELFHGANRSVNASDLSKKDVVLTSYAVMESGFRKQEVGFKRKGQLIKERSVLHDIEWHRIILDEAHNIKERSTNTAKGAFELKGTYRWCLSGTPLQNRVGELYSMIRFLGGDPYAYYYCKKCPCKSLHWSFPDRRSCSDCGHSPMVHTCYWNNEILKPIQREGMQLGEGKDAYARLRLLLERMMLRRTKLERADDMGLPPRTVEVRRDLFNEEEEDLYKSLYVEGTRKFSTYIDSGTILNNYSNIFTLLTRMRQMANHPDLVLRSKTGTAAGLLGDPSQQGSVMVCRICNEEAEDAIMSKCRHVFCRECVRQYLGDVEGEIGAGPDCPHCHALLSIDLEGEAMEAPDANVNENPRQGIIGKLDMDKWRSSTKIEALVEELTALRSEDHTIKSLVFSQFVNFLDLVAFRLQRAGFQICRLEGSMSPEARNRTINHFMGNPNITVFLLSLKAGGVALNLTEASRGWNPSVEVQAMDRVHRIGQHRPVVVKRMIIENSIESRIIELQVKKSAMIEAAIGKDDSAMGRLTVADLRFLFTL